jgi:hypothetical protein
LLLYSSHLPLGVPNRLVINHASQHEPEREVAVMDHVRDAAGLPQFLEGGGAWWRAGRFEEDLGEERKTRLGLFCKT